MFLLFFMCRYRGCFFCSRPLRRTGRVEVCLHSFFTSALDGVEWPASHLSRFTPAEKKPLCTMTKMLSGLQRRSGRFGEKRYLSPAEIQYPDHPARGLDAISITGLQTIKRTNGNTFATNIGVFSISFENMHLS